MVILITSTYLELNAEMFIKIDKVNNKAYILTPANTEYLTSLKNNEILEGYIYLHETLEKPIFPEYEEGEGFGKRGIFCKDGWAKERQQISYSWDDHWQVLWPTNGTIGVRWLIKYSTGGLWYSIQTRAKMVQYWNGVVNVNMGQRHIIRHYVDLQWRRRCGNAESFTGSYQSLGWWNDCIFPNIYNSPRALQRYHYKFWSQHQAAFNGPLFNTYNWPLEIWDSK